MPEAGTARFSRRRARRPTQGPAGPFRVHGAGRLDHHPRAAAALIGIMASVCGNDDTGRVQISRVIVGRRIAIDLNPRFEIVIDGAPIARALGLDKATFFRLLKIRKIDQLCERGTGEDAGLYRASYYYQRKRVRVVVDREGRQVGALNISERPTGGQAEPTA